MRSNSAERLLVLSSAVVLAACQDSVTAPRTDAHRAVIAQTFGGCSGWQSERQVQSLGDVYTLGGVTVTANFPGFPGIPWNLLQQMQFPLNSGADLAPCLNTPDATFTVDTLFVAPLDPLPVPEGVDPDFWKDLSPREQRALLARAELLVRLNPGKYSSVGDAINRYFKGIILHEKAESKIRANDFRLAVKEGEMLSGAIYGCELYHAFVGSPDWFLSNDETLQFVIELITAFAEAEYAFSPLRAILFGRNGAIGAAMAAAEAASSDCGWLAFNSIPSGRVRVTDPYSTSPVVPAPAPGSQQPTLPPETGLPLGWWDQ
jgi:hypothetical protein